MGNAERSPWDEILRPGKIIYMDEARAMAYAQQQSGMTDIQRAAMAQAQQQGQLNVIGSYGLMNAYKPKKSLYEEALEELDELFPGLDPLTRLTHERYVEPRYLRFLRWLAKHL